MVKTRPQNPDCRDHILLGLGRGQEGGAQVEERGGYRAWFDHWIGLKMRTALLSESAT